VNRRKRDIERKHVPALENKTKNNRQSKTWPNKHGARAQCSVHEILPSTKMSNKILRSIVLAGIVLQRYLSLLVQVQACFSQTLLEC